MILATIKYGILRTASLGFNEEIEAVAAALTKEGLEIITEI